MFTSTHNVTIHPPPLDMTPTIVFFLLKIVNNLEPTGLVFPLYLIYNFVNNKTNKQNLQNTFINLYQKFIQVTAHFWNIFLRINYGS